MGAPYVGCSNGKHRRFSAPWTCGLDETEQDVGVFLKQGHQNSMSRFDRFFTVTHFTATRDTDHLRTAQRRMRGPGYPTDPERPTIPTSPIRCVIHCATRDTSKHIYYYARPSSTTIRQDKPEQNRCGSDIFSTLSTVASVILN